MLLNTDEGINIEKAWKREKRREEEVQARSAVICAQASEHCIFRWEWTASVFEPIRSVNHDIIGPHPLPLCNTSLLTHRLQVPSVPWSAPRLHICYCQMIIVCFWNDILLVWCMGPSVLPTTCAYIVWHEGRLECSFYYYCLWVCLVLCVYVAQLNVLYW